MIQEKRNRLIAFVESPYFISGVLTVCALLLFLVSEPALSSAGDMNISELLSSSKIDSGFFFIAPWLAAALRSLNHVLLANWWSIFSVMIMFVGLFIFLWFLNKKLMHKEWLVRAFISGVFVLFYWELILRYEVNFTQTASIAGMAGIILILDCWMEKKNGHRLAMIVKISFAFLLLLITGSMRKKTLLMVLPFGMMCLGYFFLLPYSSENFFMSLRESFRTKKKVFVLAGIMVAAWMMCLGLRGIYGSVNPAWKEYCDANSARSQISDYADQYPVYSDETAEMYDSLGITASWISMIQSFFTADVNYFSAEYINRMVSLKTPSNKTIADFVYSLKGHSLLWISILTIVIGMWVFLGKKRVLLPLVLSVLAFIVGALYFVHIGRFAWRATDVYILSCVMAFIAMATHSFGREEREQYSLLGKTTLLMLAGLFLVVGLAAVRYERDDFGRPIRKVTNQELADVLDYMDGNGDTVYFTINGGIRFVSAYNMWSSHEMDYLDNVYPLTAHFTMGGKASLAEYGITNIGNDMLSKPNIYVIGDKYMKLYDYTRDYYDSCVTVSRVDEYNSYSFYRFAVPVVPEKVVDIETDCKFELINDNENDENIQFAIRSEFLIDSQKTDEFIDYYVNIVDRTTSDIYSYGLRSTDAACGADILIMDSSWITDDISVMLVGEREDGSAAAIADVTAAFIVVLPIA